MLFVFMHVFSPATDCDSRKTLWLFDEYINKQLFNYSMILNGNSIGKIRKSVVQDVNVFSRHKLNEFDVVDVLIVFLVTGSQCVIDYTIQNDKLVGKLVGLGKCSFTFT